MRFLVDASLSPRLAELLRAAGHEAEHAQEFDVLRVSDDMLFAFAASEDRVVVSSDADFEPMFVRDGLATPSLVVFDSVDLPLPDEQAAFLLATLASVAQDLDSGAIVTIAGGQVRTRLLPIEVSS